MPQFRRKPGGQPNNVNAKTHGFYSKGVSPGLAHALERAKELDNASLFQEIRLARAYMTQMLEIAPENHDIINRLLNTIVRAVAIDHSLSRDEEDAIGTALSDLLAEILPERKIP